MNKQSKQNMKLFLYFLSIILSMSIVYALVTIDNRIPIGGSWNILDNGSVSSNVEFNGTCIGDNHTYLVNLSEEWTLGGGSYQVNISDIEVTNDTEFNITVDKVPEGIWQWYFTCWNDTLISPTYDDSNKWVIKIDTIGPEVIINGPLNTTFGGNSDYINSSSILFNATCIDTNPHQMYLDINDALNSTRNYGNNTEETWYVDFVEDGNYTYNIRCDDDAGNMAGNDTNITFILDITSPTITLLEPEDGSYDLDGNITVNFTITENNTDTCELWGNFTLEGHDINFSNGDFFNQTLNTSQMEIYPESNIFNEMNISYPGIVTNTTGFNFAIKCNDTLNNIVYSSNYSIKIDIEDPVDTINLSYPFNVTTGSDYKPNFSWLPIADHFFEKYTIFIDNDSDFSSPVTYDITNNETGDYEITADLIGDTQYYWKINLTTTSGRGIDSNETFRYYKTDSVCHDLITGYNYCGIVRDDLSVWDGSYNTTGIPLDQIQMETDANYIYYYNASHDWITYQNGTSTDRYYNVTTGEVIVIYKSSAGVWPVNGGEYAGRIWSFNQSFVDPSRDINFTNYTDGYNLFSIKEQEGRTFINISQALDMQGWGQYSEYTSGDPYNGSIPYMTYVNNSGNVTCHGESNCGQFVPFRYNWTINNETSIKYGEAIWAYLNDTTFEGQSAYWNISCYFNQTATLSGDCY